MKLFSSTGASLGQFAIPNGGDGVLVNVPIGVTCVTTLEVHFPISGAIVDICKSQSGTAEETMEELFCDEEVLFSDFEGNRRGGYGIWIDGGNDALHDDFGSPRAIGTHAVRLRDDSGSSMITSDPFDLSYFQNLTLNFSYYTTGTENRDEFHFEISTDGGSTFSIVDTWTFGTDFTNNTRIFDTVNFNGPFSNQVVFRFRNDMTNNGDRVHLDNILIDGCTNHPLEDNLAAPVAHKAAPLTDRVVLESPTPTVNKVESLEPLSIHPNPASDVLNVIGDIEDLNFEIFNTTGAIIKKGQLTKTVDVNHLENGTYILRTSDGRIARFIKLE